MAAPVLPVGYVISASRIADRRIILAGYRLADLLTRVTQNWRRIQFNPGIAAWSLDHLICSEQHRLRNRQADLFRGFEIDDELKLGRLLDRKVGGFRTFEDLVNINGSAPETITLTGCIRQ